MVIKTIRIFISSVQKEFAVERAALRDYLRGESGKIVRLIEGKSDITIPELAARLKRTIERLLNRLKADEIIERVGPAKGGHWEVLR